MDFHELVEQARAVEKSAVEKKPYTTKLELPKTIDFSPEESVDKTYHELLNDYERLIKIMKASGVIFEPVAARIETPAPAPEIKPQIQVKPPITSPTISSKDVKPPTSVPTQQVVEHNIELERQPVQLEVEKKKILSAPEEKKETVLEEAEKSEPKIPEPEFRMPEPEEKPESMSQIKPEEPESAPTSVEKSISETTKEIMGEAEEGDIPYLTKHENISLLIPPLLSANPENVAEQKYSELESKIPQATEKIDESTIKKRMLELTKQLFKEKSVSQRDKIKSEISSLREMLSRKMEMPKRTSVSYVTNFFNAMEVDQRTELAAAKEHLFKQYKDNLSKTLASFSSALKQAKNSDERKQIYETFVSDLDAIKNQVKSLSNKYESFFLREHTFALEKLRNLASLKNDKYALEKIEAKLKDMKFAYAAEFLAFEEAVRKELTSLEKSKKHEALETTISEEMEKILSIINMNSEELLNYMHISHPDKYKELETGKVTKLELISAARILMASEAGLSKDTINKYFGEI